MESSLNPNFYTMEPDQPQRGRTTACVIAQQYSSFLSFHCDFIPTRKNVMYFSKTILYHFLTLQKFRQSEIACGGVSVQTNFLYRQKHAASQEILTTRWYPHTWPLLISNTEPHPPYIYHGNDAGKAAFCQEHLRPWTSSSKYEFQISFEMTATVAPKSISIVGVWRRRRGS